MRQTRATNGWQRFLCIASIPYTSSSVAAIAEQEIRDLGFGSVVARESRQRLRNRDGRMRYVIALVLATAAPACTRDRAAVDSARADSARLALEGTPSGDTLTRGADGTWRMRIERREDLIGDGAAEQLTVSATGPSVDALDVRLEIRVAGDSLLYVARWNSSAYLKYMYGDSVTPALREREIKKQLRAVLADSAFGAGPTRTPRADPAAAAALRDAIEYDLREHAWRAAHAVADTSPLPREGLQGMEHTKVSPALVDSLVGELGAARSFRYFKGGEETYAITWSPTQHRFVRVFACC